MGQVWNSTLTRRTPLKKATKPLKRSTKPIAKVTKKRAAELSLYEKNKKQYFKLHSVCEFPGCDSVYICLHHLKGRRGPMLTNMAFFKSLCNYHHMWVHDNDLEARKMGLLLTRV